VRATTLLNFPLRLPGAFACGPGRWQLDSGNGEALVTLRLSRKRLVFSLCRYATGHRYIGVDEISWRKHHRYLILVSDHATSKIVWGAAGKDTTTVEKFSQPTPSIRCAARYGRQPESYRTRRSRRHSRVRRHIPEFVKAGRTIPKHRDGISAAINRGLSNGRHEGPQQRRPHSPQ
jgi:transposase